MIKLNANRPAIRETTAMYEYTNDAGETKSEEITIRYFAHSIGQLRDIHAKARELFSKAKEKEEPAWLSLTLPFQVESLPGIAGLDGKPLKSVLDAKGYPTAKTIANFEAMPRHNLNAIERAITEDLIPKEQPIK